MKAEASSSRLLAVSFQYEELNSVRPSIFSYGPRPKKRSTRFTRAKGVHQMDLVLTSQLGNGATGVTHGGVLSYKHEGKLLGGFVVAKFAFSAVSQARLFAEYENLRKLRQVRVNGIPDPIGFFHDRDEQGPSCLIMSYAGKPLYKMTRRILTEEQRCVCSPLP